MQTANVVCTLKKCSLDHARACATFSKHLFIPTDKSLDFECIFLMLLRPILLLMLSWVSQDSRRHWNDPKLLHGLHVSYNSNMPFSRGFISAFVGIWTRRIKSSDREVGDLAKATERMIARPYTLSMCAITVFRSQFYDVNIFAVCNPFHPFLHWLLTRLF